MARIINEAFQTDSDSKRYREAVTDFREAASDLVRLYTGDTEIVKAFRATLMRQAEDAAGRCEQPVEALYLLCHQCQEKATMFREHGDEVAFFNLCRGFESAVNLAAEQVGLDHPVTRQGERP